MKACPFCAEEIHDAAIVCKHCRRRVMKRPWGWGHAVGLVVLVLLVGAWLVSGGQEYAAFDARRATWHRQCDEFVGKTTNEINAIYKPGFANDLVRTCERELAELTAYGKAKGW